MSFESLYIGSTGLKAHGTRMNVIGNNVANVNTLAFKTATSHFQTLISETITAGEPPDTGISQTGKGVGIADIITDFSTGSFEPGSFATDLAIAGKGFFAVVREDTTHYTRAGNFRPTKEGFLVDPNQYRLQGFPALATGGFAAVSEDIQLPGVEENNQEAVLAPKATTMLSIGANLGERGDSVSEANDPFFSLFQSWNATADNPLTAGGSSLTPFTVYDENGGVHEVTLSYDEVTVDNAAGQSFYEFVVTIPPDEDGRAAFAETSSAGMLMTGTLSFSATGELTDMSAFSYGGGPPGDLTSWVPAGFAEDGGLLVPATFATGTDAYGNPTGGTNQISLQLGLLGTGWNNAPANAAAIGTNAGNLPDMSNIETTPFQLTAYDGSSSILHQSQDGYGIGYLTGLYVDRDGILLGRYSNNQEANLYQIPLYSFINEYGLHREGGNHFSASLASGEAQEGLAMTGSRGYVLGDRLETSNVDLADQFSHMIITERGFQANSKVITTQDSILQILTNLKR